MEKQLDNLSSLVHSALMSKGASQSIFKDIEMLRREILGPNMQINSHSDVDAGSETGSLSKFSGKPE